MNQWSFTSWSTYNTCPAKYKFKYEQRLKGLPPGPAAQRGIDIHDSIDLYIRSEISAEKLHPAINQEVMLPIMDLYRNHPNGERFTELPVYIKDTWESTIKAFRWCTMVFDACRAGGDWQLKGTEEKDPHEGIVSVAEWKSGSPKDDHKDQRMLYGPGALAWFSYYETVQVTTYYVEGKFPPVRTVFKRSAEEKLQKLWNGRVETIDNDEIKAPRPGMYCRWCDYAKDRGGPCMF